MSSSQEGPSLLARVMPIAGWLPKYDRSLLFGDLMAGLAVWAMTVPQAFAYAGIAGVPPIYGLYAVPLAMLAYAFFGTSRTMCVGPESALAIISAVTVAGLVSSGDLSEFLALTSLLALLVGAIFLLFGILKLGWLSNFLSQPVLQGFTQGIALIVIVSQIPLVFGSNVAFKEQVAKLGESLPTGFFTQAWALVGTIGNANPATAAIGVAGLVLLFLFKRFLPNAPASLVVVLLGVLAAALIGHAEHGIHVLGKVETGMVPLSVPTVDLAKIAGLLPGAFAIVLLGYSVSLSVASVGAEETGEKIDPDQELVALGISNLGASFCSGFVVCGSLSRGVVIRRARGSTQVVTIINAVLVLLTLVVLLPIFYQLPYAILSAVVIVAMSGLLNFPYLARLWRTNRGEFACAMATLLAVLTLGILQGVAIGVLLSLAFLIRHVTRPGSAILGRIEGTDSYRDRVVHPEVVSIPGLLIFRFDAPIIFPNAGYFASEVSRHIDSADEPVREVLIAAQQINHLDSTGADQLRKLIAKQEKEGITVSIAEAKAPIIDVMSRTGLEDGFGPEHIHDSIAEGVRIYQEHTQTATST
jgi:SulP family sulfate permease